MKGIWGILAIVLVIVVGGVIFMYGTRSGAFEKDVQSRLAESQEVKAALAKIDEIRLKINEALSKAGQAASNLLKDIEKEAAPELAKLSKKLEEIAVKLNQELKEVGQKVDKTAMALQTSLGRLTHDGRAKALELFAAAKEKIEKLETSIAVTTIALKAAFKTGSEEYQAEKAKLETQTQDLRLLRESLNELEY